MAILNQPFVTANLGALNAVLSFNPNVIDGANLLTFHILGTYVGTVVLESSVDNINFIQIPVRLYNSSNTQIAQVPNNGVGIFTANISGFKIIRLRLSAYTSGLAIASMTTSTALLESSCIIKPADLAVTSTGTASATVTLTLPAAGLNLYHHISCLYVEKHASALLTAGATPILCTTTNLNSLAFSIPADASAQGTVYNKTISPCSPIRSQVPNTATTIVCPVSTGVIWRVTAHYYCSN